MAKADGTCATERTQQDSQSRPCSPADSYRAPAAPGILNIHLWAPAFEGFGGGITAFSRELSTALGSLGHELRLFGKTDVDGESSGYPLTGGKSRLDRLQTPTFVLKTLAATARYRPALIVSTHVNFGPVAQTAQRMFATPYMLVAHGIDVHEGLSAPTLAALRAADCIVAVSAWTRRRVLALGSIEESKVAVLPNTFDETRFSVAPRAGVLAQRYAIAPGEKIILTVARLDPGERYKGYDRVVRALAGVIAACGPVRFIIVGGGEDRARVEAVAREAGVENAVTFAGFVRDDELADHYRLADVFAMPSTGEGFGIVFLEAMACGTPVLGGNTDGSTDALADGALGRLVDPVDGAGITEALVCLLTGMGPAMWFDRQALHRAVVTRFGRAAFRERVNETLFAGRTFARH